MYMAYFPDIYYVRYRSLIFKIWFFWVMDVVNLTSALSEGWRYDYLTMNVNNKHLVVSATFLLKKINILNMKLPTWNYQLHK